MKHVAVFTSSRSDWGILSILVDALVESAGIKVTLLASGSHSDSLFGNTINEVNENYSEIVVSLDPGPVGETPEEATRMAGRLLEMTGRSLAEIKPDCLVILGDRFEALSCTISGLLNSVPVLHIHGGELTSGAIDDSVRHSISKIAQIHFPAHARYRGRLLQLGEEPNSIRVVGSLAVEGLENRTLDSRGDMESFLARKIPDNSFVCAVHPVTASPGETEKILDALETLFFEDPSVSIFLTSPAPDPGHQVVQNRFDNWCANRPDKFFFEKSLGSRKFLSLVAISRALVGNSSSGLIETPSLGVPTINIGSRQDGRIRADSVVDANPGLDAIRAAFDKVKNPQFRAIARKTVNPLTGVSPSKSIVNFIEQTDFSALGRKKFIDWEPYVDS